MEKRELPTRHNFLTEAVKNLLEPKVATHEPLIDSNSIITVTADPSVIKKYERHEKSFSPPLPTIEQVPQVTRIKPVTKLTKKELDQITDQDASLDEEYYLKRHRRHEKEEKTQKNREKERLKHGYYQQKQLVERIKTMDKSSLQSIVSSIRHRTHYEGGEEEEDEYLNDLHCRLLNDAVDHLRRYELLGLSNEKQEVEEHKISNSLSPVPTPTNSTTTTTFQQTLQSEAIKQRERQIKSFSNHPMFVGDSLHRNTRRSGRHVVAFGQKVPEFDDICEFALPDEILNWKKK